MPSAARRPAPGTAIATRLSSPGADLPAIVDAVLRHPERIAELFEGLASGRAGVKYGSAKVLRLVSERSPELLYPHFDLFFRLFEGDNTFLRWGSTRILGNLACVDRDGKFEQVFGRYFAPVAEHEMIGAANVIAAAARIAVAKPHLADRIAREILKVERSVYKTPECRQVAIGHAIRSLECFFPLLGDRRAVFEFVARQLDSPRPATRRKAERFRKRWAG